MKALKFFFAAALVLQISSCSRYQPAKSDIAMNAPKAKATVSAMPEIDALEAY